MTDYLIMGQGNPGAEHAGQRHNLGFWVVDALARRHGIKLQGPRFWQKNHAEAGRGDLAGADVILMKPQTFYNGTGRALQSFMTRERVKPERIIVVYDDLDLPEGRIRLRPEGSHGGNNGLKSIIEAIGSTEFGRVRVGVGRPWANKLPSWDQEVVIKWLLSKPPAESRDVLDSAVERACDAIDCVIRDGWERAMDLYNRKD